jgi:hypothetical protein
MMPDSYLQLVLHCAIIMAMDDTTPPEIMSNEEIVSAVEKERHTSPWVMISLLLTFFPLGLFYMVSQKYYHRWFSTLLFIIGGCNLLLSFVFGFFAFPQLQTLYRSLNFPLSSLSFSYHSFDFGIILLIVSVIYGFVLKKSCSNGGSLSKNQLFFAVLLIIVNLCIPEVIGMTAIQPIYALLGRMQ